MTGTFWDTIVVCTITGLCIASSGVLGSKDIVNSGQYTYTKEADTISVATRNGNNIVTDNFVIKDVKTDNGGTTLVISKNDKDISMTNKEASLTSDTINADNLARTWIDSSENEYVFEKDGTGKLLAEDVTYTYVYSIKGEKLTIDFTEEIIRDCDYTVSVNNTTQTLVGGIYKLNKKS